MMHLSTRPPGKFRCFRGAKVYCYSSVVKLACLAATFVFQVWSGISKNVRQLSVVAVGTDVAGDFRRLRAQSEKTRFQTFEVPFSSIPRIENMQRAIEPLNGALHTPRHHKCIIHFTEQLLSLFVSVRKPRDKSLVQTSSFPAICGGQFLFPVRNLGDTGKNTSAQMGITITQYVDSMRSLEKYAASMFNRQVFADVHKYELLLGIGRGVPLTNSHSMFGKPLVLSRAIHATKSSILCNLDMDGWFVSFLKLEPFLEHWPHPNFILVPSTDQGWLNTGFVCFRRSPRTSAFVEQWHGLRSFFRRRPADQPAFWYTLLMMWYKENRIKLPHHKSCKFCAWNETGPYLECLQTCVRKAEELNNIRIDKPKESGLPYLSVYESRPGECKMHSLMPGMECDRSLENCPFIKKDHATLCQLVKRYRSTLFFHAGSKNWLNFSEIILHATYNQGRCTQCNAPKMIH